MCVLYLVRCLESITFQIDGLLMVQSQKSLRQSKIPACFAAKKSKIVKKLKIVHNCLDMTVTSLMYHFKYINKFIVLLQKSAVGS